MFSEVGFPYGLQTSAAMWHNFLSEFPRGMGFVLSEPHPDIRVRGENTMNIIVLMWMM